MEKDKKGNLFWGWNFQKHWNKKKKKKKKVFILIAQLFILKIAQETNQL